jgi:hydroxymethylglutaryl-CoA lyase
MKIELVETPRDAMQGIKAFIPTDSKAAYINALLKVGFDIIDFGSFVSPKAIPQLADTTKVLEKLDLSESKSKLLAIVANTRGANTGAEFDKITYLGYPHSISNTFLQRNINSSLEKSRNTVEDIMEICLKKNKILTVYLSMGFGNPYGEAWHVEQLENETAILRDTGVKRIVLSDTVGMGSPERIEESFERLVPLFPEVQFGLHLHTTLEHWCKKLDAAFKHGCNSFDGVINGIGGCPMAGYELVGNIRTGLLLQYLRKNKANIDIDKEAFENAITKSITTFALLKYKS